LFLNNHKAISYYLTSTQIDVIIDVYNYERGYDMFEDIKKALLIGVGSTAIAVDKAVEQVDKLVSRGKLTVSEGKKLTEELIQKKNNTLTSEDKETLEAVLLEMNVAQRQDIDDLEEKVKELERKLDNKSTDA